VTNIPAQQDDSLNNAPSKNLAFDAGYSLARSIEQTYAPNHHDAAKSPQERDAALRAERLRNRGLSETLWDTQEQLENARLQNALQRQRIEQLDTALATTQENLVKWLGALEIKSRELDAQLQTDQSQTDLIEALKSQNASLGVENALLRDFMHKGKATIETIQGIDITQAKRNTRRALYQGIGVGASFGIVATCVTLSFLRAGSVPQPAAPVTEQRTEPSKQNQPYAPRSDKNYPFPSPR
jgi:small-conductance mechanosensitive channel